MPLLKQILKSYRVVAAGRARKCYHSRKHEIRKGDTVLEVKDGLAWPGYCAECAKEMLRQARSGLDDLERDIPTA